MTDIGLAELAACQDIDGSVPNNLFVIQFRKGSSNWARQLEEDAKLGDKYPKSTIKKAKLYFPVKYTFPYSIKVSL